MYYPDEEQKNVSYTIMQAYIHQQVMLKPSERVILDSITQGKSVPLSEHEVDALIFKTLTRWSKEVEGKRVYH